MFSRDCWATDSKPRSCVNFAEIVCRFRRDRVSISSGDRLGYVRNRLRFWEKKSSPRWRIVGKREFTDGEVDKYRRGVVE